MGGPYRGDGQNANSSTSIEFDLDALNYAKKELSSLSSEFKEALRGYTTTSNALFETAFLGSSVASFKAGAEYNIQQLNGVVSFLDAVVADIDSAINKSTVLDVKVKSGNIFN
ncbi:MAG: hypothetical protein Q4G04_00150 [bacterium]|nr:hypothetical protein [bacterium]